MSQAEPWTIKRLLDWTADYLKRSGSESPRLDAEVLLADVRKCRRIELYTGFDLVPSEGQLAQFREWVKRRAAGEPVAYLVGRRDFYSLAFRVTRDVLIPRPETELLIVTLLDLAERSDPKAPRLADVGTGSGIIAICAAVHLPQANITAIDLSARALDVARANAAEHAVTERISFLEGDLLGPLPEERSLDFVLSNPPYVSQSELAGLARDVRDYEPHQALVAGPKGTEVIERLVPQAAARLKPGGYLLMEISPMIERGVLDLVQASGQFAEASSIKDLAQLPRVVKARRN